VSPTLDARRGRPAIGVVAVLAGLVAAAWGTTGGGTGAGVGAPEARAIVLVSGRDDHGLPVADQRPLHAAPDGAEVGRVAADTLVRVHETRGSWLRVSSLEGPAVEGWIDDFLTRGDLHVVLPDAPGSTVATAEGDLPPSARVRVSDIHVRADGSIQVGVTPVTDDREYHVERAWIREASARDPRASFNSQRTGDGSAA
jgi:hypothetical protein